ncbi:MAG: hypothetical protein ACK521_08310 [bacterium]
MAFENISISPGSAAIKEPNFEARSLKIGVDTCSSKSSMDTGCLMHESRKLSMSKKEYSKMDNTAQFKTGTFKSLVIQELEEEREVN